MVGNNTISQCIKGDQQAYSVLYRSCAPYVFTIIKNYFTPDDDRKDAMQEVFAQIFLSIDKFDEEKGSFKAWISKIAVYQSIAILRKKDKIQIGFGLEVVDEENYDTLDALEKLSVDDLEKMLVLVYIGLSHRIKCRTRI
ncbi:MAG: sigma-70 family RNA polymerase sigma factor [Saprospiraceae bacterium]|nr:sigma-70 family RNA polymerase sigma factor [Saprospiraceae bacterium]